MVIVHYGHPGVLLVVRHRAGVGIDGIARVGRHVGDGQALRHVPPQEVCPGEGGDELECLGGETSDNPLGTSDEDKLLSDRETVGAANKIQ